MFAIEKNAIGWPEWEGSGLVDTKTWPDWKDAEIESFTAVFDAIGEMPNTEFHFLLTTNSIPKEITWGIANDRTRPEYYKAISYEMRRCGTAFYRKTHWWKRDKKGELFEVPNPNPNPIYHRK